MYLLSSVYVFELADYDISLWVSFTFKLGTHLNIQIGDVTN